METPKEFYNCCNGDNLVGHKNTCLKPIFDNPDYHVFFDNDKNPAVMLIAIPVKSIAENAPKNSTMFFRGFWEETKSQAIACIGSIFARDQQAKSKLVAPNAGNTPKALRVH